MDFARKEMEKYGWKEGKGLGKDEDGIVTALKAKLKFDNAGVGAKPGDEFANQWWKDVYDRAANNLEIKHLDGEVKIGLKSGKNTDVTTTPSSVTALKKNNTLEYGTFLKTTKLTQEGMKDYQVKGKEKEKNHKPKPKAMTDDEVFKACGGRTVNQASRFGIYMSGKLSRLERQEKMLLKKMKNVSLTDVPKIEKKVKKIKEGTTSKKAIVETPKEVLTSPLKKKKKKKGSVSFNETVTEYYPLYEDPEFEDPQKDARSDSPITRTSKNTNDEGIEVDFTDDVSNESESFVKVDDLSKESFIDVLSNNRESSVNNNDSKKHFKDLVSQDIEPLENVHGQSGEDFKDSIDCNSKPFVNVDDVSKSERKKLKKKREKKNRSGGATARFMAEVEAEMSTKLIEIKNVLRKNDLQSRCRKRKLTSDDDDDENGRANKPKDEFDIKLANLKNKFKRQHQTEKRLKNVMKSMDVWKITETKEEDQEEKSARDHCTNEPNQGPQSSTKVFRLQHIATAQLGLGKSRR